MKDLREPEQSLRDRCEKLYQRMNAACVTRELKEFDLDLLESFALQIRNEALEEAKEAVSKPVPGVRIPNKGENNGPTG